MINGPAYFLKQQMVPNAEKTIQLWDGTNGKDQIPHTKKNRKDKGKLFKYLDDQRLYYPEIHIVYYRFSSTLAN